MHHLVSSSTGLAWIISSFPLGSKVLQLHDLLQVTWLIWGGAGAHICDSGLLHAVPSNEMKVLINQKTRPQLQ